MERRQCRKWAAIRIQLPDGKAETAFGAVDAEHLAILPLGIHRHPRRAEQLGKGVRTQHVVAGDDFGNTLSTALARCTKSRFKFRVGLSCILDRKRIFRSDRLFLDRRDRLSAGGRIDLYPKRHTVADFSAACDCLLIAFKQHLLEIRLRRQLRDELMVATPACDAVTL
jgi:hypothetical protein